jgi:hypothetical protein
MKTITLGSFVLIAFCLINISCKKTLSQGNSSGNNNNSGTNIPTDTAGIKTTIGTAIGSPVSKSIDASGGSIVSADGILHITVPAGALSSATTITIQPVTNTLPTGIYNGYELTPDGQKFQVPITLEFHYRDSDLDTSDAGALTVAYQLDNQTWEAYANPNVDTVNKTVTVQTNHFTLWDLLFGEKLSPENTTVVIGKTLTIDHETDVNTNVSGDELVSVDTWQNSKRGTDSWSVNGIGGGNAVVGTLTSNGSEAYYTAPVKVPSPSTVTVRDTWTFQFSTGQILKMILYSKIKIISGDETYGVKINYEQEINESGSYWNWKDQGSFDVAVKGNTGVVQNIINSDAALMLDSTVTNCSIMLISPGAGPIHIVDSSIVTISRQSDSTITVAFNNLGTSSFIQDATFGYECPGGTQTQLGGGFGPGFPTYIQFKRSHQVQTVALIPGYTMVVTPTQQ